MILTFDKRYSCIESDNKVMPINHLEKKGKSNILSYSNYAEKMTDKKITEATFLRASRLKW